MATGDGQRRADHPEPCIVWIPDPGAVHRWNREANRDRGPGALRTSADSAKHVCRNRQRRLRGLRFGDRDGDERRSAPSASSTPARCADHHVWYSRGDRDNNRHRDHRSGDHTQHDLPPNMHPAEHRELPSTLTHAISQQVKDAFFACAADVPKAARGDKPRLEGQLTTAVADHKLAVTAFVAQLRDVSSPYDVQVKSCVEQKALGMMTSANDQDDLADYGIGVTAP